jgi:hypothetical protein
VLSECKEQPVPDNLRFQSRVEPSVHLLSGKFKYTPAAKTDVAATFARLRAAEVKKNKPKEPAVVELRRGAK